MKLSHTDEEGHARMVDVSDKQVQNRRAIAKGFIRLQPDTVRIVKQNEIKKGDVLTVAEIAGIQAAKLTPSLIPLCHPLQLTKIQVKCTIEESRRCGIEVISEVKCIGQTGVEMEALTAVNIALLTIYDMCKAVDKEMEIGLIHLVEKSKE